MNEKSMIRDLTSGNATKQLVSFALPFILANLLQTCYTLTDIVIIGQFVGSEGISAVSNGGEIMNFFTFFGTGLAAGGQIVISQLAGRGERGMIKKVIGTMFSCILGFAVLLSAVCSAFTDNFLGWLRVPSEAFSMAHDYLFTCICGTFFIFGYNTVSSILRGMGDSRRPFVFVAISAVTNIILDLLFVGVLQLRAFGAALATVCGQGLSFVIAIIYLHSRREQFGFDFRPASFIPDRRCLSAFLKQGIPIALQHCAITSSMLFVSSFLNSYGLTVSAVNGVGSKLVLLSYIVTNGLNQAASSMIGQSFGAGRFDRIRTVIRSVFLIGFSFCALLSAAIALFPEQIFSLFDKDPDVLAMSHTYVKVAVVNYIGAAFRAPFTAFVNGVGFAVMNFFMGIADGIVMRVCLAMLLGLVCGLGIMGFWLGSALAGYTYFIVVFPYYLSGKWKKRRLAVEIG
ncbi:MAG: MATE family efflux transporter [Oscillospiraceae bacterium]|jgi:putative MATE family efflux protein|nr:MATE family efflux transporter [Oscillospiraceae bacterium]